MASLETVIGSRRGPAGILVVGPCGRNKTIIAIIAITAHLVMEVGALNKKWMIVGTLWTISIGKARRNRVAHAPIFTNSKKIVQGITLGRWLKKPKELCRSRLGSDRYLSLLAVGLLCYKVLLRLLVYSIPTFILNRGSSQAGITAVAKTGRDMSSFLLQELGYRSTLR